MIDHFASIRSTSTARSRLIAELSREILQKPQEQPFLLASEVALCQRFNVSRVTVRSALSELEKRGLVFRKHGVGTFVHGRHTRMSRIIGVMLKSPQWAELRHIAQYLQGIQGALTQQHASMLILNQGPQAWNAEISSQLSGVIIFPHGILLDDLQQLQLRKIPYILTCETDLPGPQIHFEQQKAAEQIMSIFIRLGHRRVAVLSGLDEYFDRQKRLGIHRVWSQYGLNPKDLVEINLIDAKGDLFEAGRMALKINPHPTAILALDDSLAGAVYQCARELNLRMPADISLASFHEWNFLTPSSPRLQTYHFPFAEAGRWAAQRLLNCSHTGEPVFGLTFPAELRPGGTVGPAPII